MRRKKKISTVGYCLIEHLISSNILFEITDNPCTVIGSHRCDLFKNRTIFFSLDRFFFQPMINLSYTKPFQQMLRLVEIKVTDQIAGK